MKKQEYFSPQTQAMHLSLDKSLLATSDAGFNGNIDNGVEEIWSGMPAAPDFLF